ncbi:hypothetical protein CONLIGDRAFT_715179 [Coniochaeta ligniaria NRRL 30616]|uniref:Uncharacterized protein n=1 Tax=Coniochaeta ligniaria NRRL 30616 TaxID=1408157 RepID=A0A1J7JHD7_9PEZI|nr:hypothetical protein CONLIGDRAFT_715179 [Coniochaeta ligniaria NRRL 30616]
MSHEQARDNAGSPELGYFYLVAAETEPESVKDRVHQEDDISSVPISHLVIDSRQQEEHNNTITPAPISSAPTNSSDPRPVPVLSGLVAEAAVESQEEFTCEEQRMMMEELLRDCIDDVAHVESLLNQPPEMHSGSRQALEESRNRSQAKADFFAGYLKKMEETPQGWLGYGLDCGERMWYMFYEPGDQISRSCTPPLEG